MIKKSLVVALMTLTGVVLSDTVAFAEAGYTHLCVAAGTANGGTVLLGAGPSTPLAATGSGMDVGAWLSAGIAILIVGLAFTLVPSRRVAGPAVTTGETLTG